MQIIKKIIYKLPFVEQLIKKLEKNEKEIQKLKNEQKELRDTIQKITLEARRNNVFREIDKVHFRKIQRDMALLSPAKQVSEESISKSARDMLYSEFPLVSIIIVNHNGRKHLRKLLESFEKREFYNNYEIIIVDNASEDDSLEVIGEYQKLLSVKVIKNDKNLSFSEANNIGVRYARGEYLLFLNNDTEVTDGWLDELMLTALTKENVGAVGATLIYPEIPADSINKGKSYTIQHEGVAFREGVRENIRYWQPYNVNNGEEVQACFSRPDREWWCVTAAVLLVKKELFQLVEGFDERYLYGYEDVDFCLKLQEKGFHNYCCGNCLVFHYEFGTQSADEPAEVRERRAKNMYVFREKWEVYLQRRMEEEK